MAKLVYLKDREDPSEEGVVIDSAGMDKEKLEAEFGMEVVEIVPLDSDCHGWPNDRLLIPE